MAGAAHRLIGFIPVRHPSIGIPIDYLRCSNNGARNAARRLHTSFQKCLFFMFTATHTFDNATEAIDTLSPEHRQAIHLAYYAGFDNNQVADLLGVSVDVADARLSEGLSSLREALRVAA